MQDECVVLGDAAEEVNVTRDEVRLGDEADAVTKKWGEYKLEKLAADINFHGAACTLGR